MHVDSATGNIIGLVDNTKTPNDTSASSMRNQHVAAIGGGNAAVEEAIYLSRITKKVTLVHRRNQLSADKTIQARLLIR